MTEGPSTSAVGLTTHALFTYEPDKGNVSARKMFGEYAIYCDAKVVALVCDDRLFVKPTVAGTAFAAGVLEAPGYPGGKPSLLIPEERWDDGERLATLIRISAANLPLPKPKPKTKGRSKSK